MKALVPCHSSTSTSASKLSRRLYHGIVQPIRALRRPISACGARETNTRVVSRAFRWAHMGDLVGHHGAAPAGMIGPAQDAGLEESALDDQLTAAVEQVDQARLPLRALELIGLLHLHPWHPPAFGRQGVASAGQGLFLHEQLPARSLPLLRRYNRWSGLRQIMLHGSLLLLSKAASRQCSELEVCSPVIAPMRGTTLFQPPLMFRYAVSFLGRTNPECTRRSRVPPSTFFSVKVTTVSSRAP